jgi:cytochrome P450
MTCEPRRLPRPRTGLWRVYYPLYTLLRKTPVRREEDGTFVVSNYAEIQSLLHDPRVSSDDRPKPKHSKTGNPLRDYIINPIKDWIIDTHKSLIFRNPPDHTRLRRLVMTQFTAERVRGMSGRVDAIIDDLIGKMRGRNKIDLVGDFAYPLPVNVICELLGVPASDGRVSLTPSNRRRVMGGCFLKVASLGFPM